MAPSETILIPLIIVPIMMPSLPLFLPTLPSFQVLTSIRTNCTGDSTTNGAQRAFADELMA